MLSVIWQLLKDNKSYDTCFIHVNYNPYYSLVLYNEPHGLNGFSDTTGFNIYMNRDVEAVHYVSCITG